MEEDIKILEEFIEAVGEEYEVVREKQALDKFIKGYRELEYENRVMKDRQGIGKIAELSGENLDKVLSKWYIPKSKVKELYKEYYEKAFAEPYDCTTADYKHSQAMGGWRALDKLLMEDK